MATEGLTGHHLDPESLVALIMEELRANPDAQRLLLRALLTNEFLGMPARLHHIEKDIAELKADVSELKTKTDRLQATTDRLQATTDRLQAKTDRLQATTDRLQATTDGLQATTDRLQATTDGLQATTDGLQATTHRLVNEVGDLKGSNLEMTVHRRIRPLLSQHLGLRRARVIQSALHEAPDEFEDQVAQAADEGRISGEQEDRITATDIILQARSSRDRTMVWIAIEVANRIDAADISRSRQSADTLAAVFGQQALPAVVGQRIDPADRHRAEAAGVRYVALSAQV